MIENNGFRAALTKRDLTSVGPAIQVLAALLYLGTLAYAFYVWYGLGFPEEPTKVVHVIPDMSKSFFALVAAALLVVLGLGEK